MVIPIIMTYQILDWSVRIVIVNYQHLNQKIKGTVGDTIENIKGFLPRSAPQVLLKSTVTERSIVRCDQEPQ
jgi:hypothetical protein